MEICTIWKKLFHLQLSEKKVAQEKCHLQRMQKDVKLSYQCCMFYVAIITQYTEEDNIQKLNQIKIFFIQLKCRKFLLHFTTTTTT